MRVKPDDPGLTEYWAALCVAESFSDKALKKFGGINFHVMKGPALLRRMEEFLEFHSTRGRKSSKKLKAGPLDGITAAVSPQAIEAAMTPKGGWKAAQLAQWGISWPPPTGWRRKLEDNFSAAQTS
ncbi:hypothetical protein LZK73_18610 [Neorhizobium galegae]|nr:hypothetical protein LZK73_18610 [Neorhizobium galegae]